MDLSPYPPCIVMMGNTTGNYNEGYAHPDSKHKIITVLLGFSREWPYERGQPSITSQPRPRGLCLRVSRQSSAGCSCSGFAIILGMDFCRRRARAQACSSAGGIGSGTFERSIGAIA